MILHAFGAPRPRRYQSGEMDYAKVGAQRMRTLLYEAVNVMLPGRLQLPLRSGTSQLGEARRIRTLKDRLKADIEARSRLCSDTNRQAKKQRIVVNGAVLVGFVIAAIGTNAP